MIVTAIHLLHLGTAGIGDLNIPRGAGGAVGGTMSFPAFGGEPGEGLMRQLLTSLPLPRLHSGQVPEASNCGREQQQTRREPGRRDERGAR